VTASVVEIKRRLFRMTAFVFEITRPSISNDGFCIRNHTIVSSNDSFCIRNHASSLSSDGLFIRNHAPSISHDSVRNRYRVHSLREMRRNPASYLDQVARYLLSNLDGIPLRRVSMALPHIHFSYNIFMP